jgi:L-seryl-tRNA(Ser) seleniumtransferase
MSQSILREIPSVSQVLEHPQLAPLVAGKQRPWMTRVIQNVIASQRRLLLQAPPPPPDTGGLREKLLNDLVQRVLAERERLLAPTLRRVINGTGVVVHTNLGRSLYPEQALQWMQAAALHNVDLEFELESGRRGHRGRKVEEKAALLTGAEDALIVNNNAAAVWLAVRTCAGEGRVILSRGESVAIGGSFRMHEILSETHCELVEIGTTNRTSLHDYRKALTPGAVILKVHRSNFDVVGFTEEATLPELAELCQQSGHTLIYDAGSGALFPFAELGLPHESTLTEDLAAGPDLVCCSGDKLLGGCQAGLVLGRAELIAAMRSHTMRRAFRVDKTTLAAMDAVLSMYLAAEERPALPTLEILARPVAELTRWAEQLLADLDTDAPPGWRGEVQPGESSVGGGSFSTAALPTSLLLWTGPKAALEECHVKLRQQDPALVTRINQDGLAVDMRTIKPSELSLIVAAFRLAWRDLA